MKRNKQNSSIPENGRHEHPLPQEISESEKQKASNALEQAEEDMENDVEFSAHSPNDDLDEGETARLGEDKTDLV
jgi:hypothetical protein